ncbi:probable glutathione S-transferase 5 isoform X2 [Patella vulgata]|uniref:probable glutathione S-transferase 5 isoform X2 n=1 Tax=Patella vulgata TaxID=6465 RepID=UPI00217FA30F|nr:probable glutathione S-transferase 5 isoform X2 [Patella vulgata]
MGKKYVYHYFNLKGRGETPRLIFAAAGVEYTDNRVEFSDWPKIKETTPLGSLPYLEVDGQKFPESVAIARYLANEFGLAGKSNLEKLKIDVIVDLLIAVRESAGTVHFEQDEAKKAELMKKFKEEQLPKCFGYIEKTLSENSSGFLVGNQLTWADLALIDLDAMLGNFGNPINLDKFPKVAAHRKQVEALPRISKYLKNRPVTPY